MPPRRALMPSASTPVDRWVLRQVPPGWSPPWLLFVKASHWQLLLCKQSSRLDKEYLETKTRLPRPLQKNIARCYWFHEKLYLETSKPAFAGHKLDQGQAFTRFGRSSFDFQPLFRTRPAGKYLTAFAVDVVSGQRERSLLLTLKRASLAAL